MSEPFIGQIWMFAGNFTPRDNAFCDGQLLDIAQNTSLFSVLGTTYGGNGRTTFGLPDLQERSPLHPGRGPGLTPRRLGEQIGVDQVSITAAQMPGHGHPMAAGGDATTSRSANGYWGITQGGGRGVDAPLIYGDSATAAFDSGTLDSVGGNQAHENRQPYQAVSFVIALFGQFPPRN